MHESVSRSVSKRGDQGASAPGIFAVAKGLGWFGVVLGTAQLLAPRLLTRPLALEGREGLTRACGVRELASGIGILATRKPAPWLWLRTGGDVLDLAGLALHAGRRPRRRSLILVALGMVAGVMALDAYSATRTQGRRWPARQPTHDYSDRSGFAKSPTAMRGVAARGEAEKGLPPSALTAKEGPGGGVGSAHRSHLRT